MTSSARKLTKDISFWLIAVGFLGLISLADYHYSISNQIPSDGPLTIGFPMTFCWMVCPMISAGAAGCHTGISALGLSVDFIVCIAFTMVAASLAMHFARKDYVRRKLFWINTSVVFAFIFLLASIVTAFHSASHHGRAVEIGFPVVYLYEYAGETFSALNLAVDLGFSLIVAFLCLAAFFKVTMDKSN